MPAYALVELTIDDRDGMGPYMEKVADTVAAFEGRYLVRAGETEVLEGTLGEHPLKVLIEFPSMAAARDWYRSDAYQAILSHRLDNSRANFILVEGV